MKTNPKVKQLFDDIYRYRHELKRLRLADQTVSRKACRKNLAF